MKIISNLKLIKDLIIWQKPFSGLIILFFVLHSLFFINSVFAAEMYFESDLTAVKPGETFKVMVFLDTNRESINAVEGTVSFSPDILKLENINEGNSIINFWLEKPVIYDDNKIKFSGITPGGYQGKKGYLFSIFFRAKNEGVDFIKIKDNRALLNDGQGTPANLKNQEFKILVSKEIFNLPSIEEVKDIIPPEEFNLEIAQSAEVFEGRYFLVFSTQDKDSGINYYQVCEGSKKKCVIAESPYLLKNQNLSQDIFVKAVDKSGNERLAAISAPKPFLWNKNYYFFAILLIIGLVCGFYLQKILWINLRKKRTI